MSGWTFLNSRTVSGVSVLAGGTFIYQGGGTATVNPGGSFGSGGADGGIVVSSGSTLDYPIEVTRQVWSYVS